jgi:hypothetical protein
MLPILREIDLSFIPGPSRATRTTEDFSRPIGTAFRLAPVHETPRGDFRIPISWSEEGVEFSLSLLAQKPAESHPVSTPLRKQKRPQG